MKAAVAVLLVLALVRVAVAAPEADDQTAARDHFARGSAHFKLNNYEAALVEFSTAYQLSHVPGLLFNMGQAALAARRYDLARDYFSDYLEQVPQAPERTYVEERLRDIELTRSAPLPAAEPESPSVAAPPPTPAGARVPAVPAGADHPGRGLRIAGIGSAAVGAALVATAIGFGVSASHASDDVSDAFERGATFTPELEELYRKGRRNERVATITGIAGGALVAGGAILWVLGVRAGRRDAVAVGAGPGNVGVSASWTF